MRREAEAVEALEPATIQAATEPLGLLLEPAQAGALARFAQLLLRWNAVHNLTAIESPAQVLTHHLLDSLSILPELRRRIGMQSMRVLDVGAGGGLPGVPLAIAGTHLHVTLVDKVQKKAAFLTQVKLELALSNVDVVHTRVETLARPRAFDLIVTRAFASLAHFVQLTRHLLARHGSWCAMKGARPSAELDELSRVLPDVRFETIALRVPGLRAERHLVLMQPQAE